MIQWCNFAAEPMHKAKLQLKPMKFWCKTQFNYMMRNKGPAFWGTLLTHDCCNGPITIVEHLQCLSANNVQTNDETCVSGWPGYFIKFHQNLKVWFNLRFEQKKTDGIWSALSWAGPIGFNLACLPMQFAQYGRFPSPQLQLDLQKNWAKSGRKSRKL